MKMLPVAHHHPRRTGHSRRQDGSVLVNAAIALLALVTLVLGLEVGVAYYQKRALQKAADMAALAGANELLPTQCSTSVYEVVEQTVAANTGLVPTIQAQCGRWAAPASSAGELEDGFMPPPLESSLNFNAVQVKLDAALGLFGVQGLFLDGIHISVKAVATRSEPQARFSVGSQLLRTNQNAVLGRILQLVGLDIGRLTALDSAGLANVKITPAGLLRALGLTVDLDAGVLTPESVAALPTVSVAQILNVALDLVEQGSVLHTNLDLLRRDLIDVAVDDLQLALFSTDSSPGLLSLNFANGGADPAALDTNIDLGSLMKTSLGIATSGRSVTVPELNVLGLVDVQAGIVEPPSIGIGGVGARAYNAQVRLYLDVDSNNLLGGVLSPLLSGLLGTRVHLPIYIDVVNGFGEITALSCQAPRPHARIEVTSSVLRTCVGGLDDESVRFSSRNLCEENLQNEQLVKLLHLPIPGATHIDINALHQTEELILDVGQTGSTSPNNLAVGTLVSELVDSLLGTLGDLLNPTQLSGTQKANALADSYLSQTKDTNGFYVPNAVIDLLQNGNAESGSPGLGNWDRTVWVQDPVLGLFPYQKTMSVWDALRLYTTPSGGLLGVVGVGQSCASLLQSLLAWNECVRSKVVDALNSAPRSALEAAAEQLEGDASLSGPGGANGFLNVLLSPVLAVVEGILNGLGSLLSETLESALGLQLGRTDVTLHEVDCGRPRLVY